MTNEQHRFEVDKLSVLEDELIKMISEQDNDDLSALFLNWMEQRNVCNEGFVKFMETELEKQKPITQ